MKKILSILLISILLFSNLIGMTAVLADEAVAAGSEQAAVVLERLGIVSLTDVDMQDNTPISRGSFA